MASIWKTVRIFVSSTFRDMHAERDHLVRFVFPELRERCARRGLYLVDVDLRWGVAREEEAERGKALEVCLDEIERCKPFFIGILGERYGTVQENYDVPDEPHYDWVRGHEPGHSITAMEIVHGVLRNPVTSHRSFFYLRDPKFLSDVPAKMQADYLAEGPQSAQKLEDLRKKIHASGRPIMENYPSHWDKKGQCVGGLEAFGQRVLDDLWKAISEEYPEDAPEPDPLVIERQMHEAFMEERTRVYLTPRGESKRLFVGREGEAVRLSKYVRGEDRRAVVITGGPGSGKSAFLSNWYREYSARQTEDFVLPYFVGASPASTSHFRLLRNVCEELRRQFSLSEEIPADDKKLPEALALILSSASREKKGRIILIIDALDQLQRQEGVEGLDWILDYLPEGARLVTSCLEGDYLGVLRRRQAEEIPLPPLTNEEQQEVVRSYLGMWRKELDKGQMSALLKHSGVSNPLYLRVAMEELRLFQFYGQLTQRIQGLAEDVGGMFNQVLERLEKDHGKELVSEAFCLIACSRYGLGETELLDLLKRKKEEQLPRTLWIRLYRSARAYLVQRGDLTGFFHLQLGEAVKVRYRDYRERHARLSGYFEKSPIDRRLDEYPYQLQQAGEQKALANALSELDLFHYAQDKGRKYEWMGYWNTIKERFKPGDYYRRALELKEKKEGQTESLAYSLNAVASFLYEMALYPEAEPLFKRSLEILKKRLGEDHPSVAASLNNLALLYDAQGRYEQAEPLFKRSLEIWKKRLGEDHPDVATSLNNLALLYKAQGRYGQAEPLCKRSLEIRKKRLGEDHPDVATSLNNLAALYDAQGRYGQAEPLYKRSLEIRKKRLGEDHPDVAQSLNNLALLYKAQGRYEQAEPLYKRSLEIRKKRLGEDHPDVATSLNNLAGLYYAQGRYEQAEPLYKRALEIGKKRLGEDHPDVATSLNNLAGLYYSQGRHEQAEPLFKGALEIDKKALGEDHPGVATDLNNLAALYISTRRLKEALPLLERACQIARKTLGEDHPNTRQMEENLKRLRSP